VAYFVAACDLSCDKQVIKSANVFVEPPHLLALWDRRRVAQAGNLDTLPRDTSRPPCEFIHCKCSVSSVAKEIGKIRSIPNYWDVSVCSVEFVSTVWDTGVSNASPSTCEGLGSGNHMTMTSIMTTAQQLDLLPTCHTQVQLSIHQMAHEHKRIRRALDRR